MARQDQNTTFADTSFLDGANAAYLEALQVALRGVAGQRRCGVAGLLRRHGGTVRPMRPPPRARPGRTRAGRCSPTARSSLRSTATGAPSRRRSATRSRPRSLIPPSWRRPLVRHRATPTCQRATRDSVRALMMIRCLSHARPPACQPRPAGPRTARATTRNCSPSSLRLRRSRLRPPDLHRRRARDGIRHHPGDDADPAPDLLFDDRLRIHAYLGSRREGLDPDSASRGRTRRSPSPARARRRSSTSWSRPRASRSSST